MSSLKAQQERNCCSLLLKENGKILGVRGAGVVVVLVLVLVLF